MEWSVDENVAPRRSEQKSLAVVERQSALDAYDILVEIRQQAKRTGFIPDSRGVELRR